MKVLLIDFHDSFTYNIYHYLIGCDVDAKVVEDGKLDINEIESYDAVIFSPGPGLPKNTIHMFSVLERYAKSKKILGICLGMQGIAQFFGASIYNQKQVKHGVSERMNILRPDTLFKDLPIFFEVGLYHSWAVDVHRSDVLEILSESENGVVMAIKHKSLNIYGVQFHPESILTEHGKNILVNFLFS